AALTPRLACVDFRALEITSRYDYLIAIQVFQHGAQIDAHEYFARTAAVLKAGGLFFLRVNSASTAVYLRHTIVDRNDFGGLTVRYDEGPKSGLCVHFYSREEPVELAGDRIVPCISAAAAVSERPSVSASANPNVFLISDLLRKMGHLQAKQLACRIEMILMRRFRVDLAATRAFSGADSPWQNATPWRSATARRSQR